MIIFLYGKDNFRSLRKLKEIIEEYEKVHKNGLNLRVFDLENSLFKDFRDEFQTRSIFRENRLFVLKNVSANPLFQQKSIKALKRLSGAKDIIVFYERKEVPAKNPFFIALKKNSQTQEFKPLKTNALESWTKKEFSAYGARIKPKALQLLLKATGNDLWRLSNEIQKLVSYKRNDKTSISESDIEIIIRTDSQESIFKTLDLIASKQKQKAIAFLHQDLERGESPLYLLSMIAFEFRKLLLMKEHLKNQQSIWNLGWRPFQIRKIYQLSQGFELKELRKIYQKIIQTDLDIKTGKIDAESAIDLLIVQI